jgi:hypothetical protein
MAGAAAFKLHGLGRSLRVHCVTSGRASLYLLSEAMVFVTGELKQRKNHRRLLNQVVLKENCKAHGDDDALLDDIVLLDLINSYGGDDVKFAFMATARAATDATIEDDETESLHDNLSVDALSVDALSAYARRAPSRCAKLVADIARKFPEFKASMLAKLQGAPTKPLAEVQDSKARRESLWNHLFSEFSPKGEDLDAVVAGFAKLFEAAPGLLHMIVQHPLSEASRDDINRTFVRERVIPAMTIFSASVRAELSARNYNNLRNIRGIAIQAECFFNPLYLGERAAAYLCAQNHSGLPSIGDVRTFLDV